MPVVVHISTYKTGTTSIQHFCASNRGELLRRGIYYPLSRYSPRNLNRLASQVARGHRDEAKMFLMRTVETAANRGADRIPMLRTSHHIRAGKHARLSHNKRATWIRLVKALPHY